jgi:predicted CoA-binding protein
VSKVVAVVGASSDRGKYGNKAVRAYAARGWKVYPVNPSAKEIEGIPAAASILDIPEHINRVTLYLPPKLGMGVLERVARCAPDEFYVNPGADSDELVRRAKELGLDPILACSIVEIGSSPSSFPEE